MDDVFPPEKRWDFENGFYLTSNSSRLAKAIAHYELYRRIVNLPGDVVELGVYKGTSLIRFATFREFLEGPGSRKIIGFDMFGEFPREDLSANDETFVNRFEGEGGDGLALEDLMMALGRKGFSRIQLVQGDVYETVPRHLEQNPAQRISLLHLDMDVYGPTAFALETLYPRLVSGGLLVIDDFSTVAGATEAVDEFLTPKGIPLEKLPIAHVPAFAVKP